VYQDLPAAFHTLRHRVPDRLDLQPVGDRKEVTAFLKQPFASPPLGPPNPPVYSPGAVLYSCVPYLPGALALLAGSIVKAPSLPVFYVGRLMQLVAFVALVGLALTLLPGFRLPLTVLSLMPMTLHQASAYSADGLTTGMSFLFIAVCLRLALGGVRKLRADDYAAVALLILIIALCKFNGLILLLLVLIPVSRFGTVFRKASAIAASLLLYTAVTVAWQTSNSGNLAHIEQIRTQAGVDMRANALVLTQQPIAFVAAAIRTVAVQPQHYVRMFVGHLGLITVALPFWTVVGVLGMIAVSTLTAGLPNIPAWWRLLLLILAVASILIVFAILWIAYTPTASVGSGFGLVWGIQSRYFIPIAPLALIACSRRRIRCTRTVFLTWVGLMVLMNISALRVLYTAYFG
jgi:uncharacterized membrane protein